MTNNPDAALADARAKSEAAQQERLDCIARAIELAALQAGATPIEVEGAMDGLYAVVQITGSQLEDLK